MTIRLFFISALLCQFSIEAKGSSIHEFNSKILHLHAGIDIPGYDLKFIGNAREVQFNPNLFGLFSVGASLQNVAGINWGFKVSQKESEKLQKGDTQYEDWRLNFAFSQFHVFLNYSQYKGFYVQDSSEVDPLWTPGDPYYQAPNLYSRTLSANFTWIFSPDDYSLVAAMDQTARQESSGGSWLAGLQAVETVFHDDSEIIPTNIQSSYSSEQNLKEGKFLGLNLKGGYGYTLVFAKKYFASIAAQLGFGPLQMKLRGTDFDRSKWTQSGKADGLISFGWNGDEYYSGILIQGDATHFKTGNIQIDSTLWMGRIYFGLRL